MKKIAVVFSLLILAACSAKITPTTSTTSTASADVARGAAKFPGYTLAQLQQGKTDYEKYCTQCHSLKNPTSQTEEKWNKIVPWMCDKTNKKDNLQHINAETQASILKYVITMSGVE